MAKSGVSLRPGKLRRTPGKWPMLPGRPRKLRTDTAISETFLRTRKREFLDCQAYFDFHSTTPALAC
jgi:hypothetical protein